MVYRPDGKALRFSGNGVGVWTADADFKVRLEKTLAGWRLTTSDEQAEHYDSSGNFISLVDREGAPQP